MTKSLHQPIAFLMFLAAYGLTSQQVQAQAQQGIAIYFYCTPESIRIYMRGEGESNVNCATEPANPYCQTESYDIDLFRAASGSYTFRTEDRSQPGSVYISEMTIRRSDGRYFYKWTGTSGDAYRSKSVEGMCEQKKEKLKF